MSTPRRRLAPELRRRMLLDAARTVIAARGLHATTLRDVAAAGEVAVGTVTYHFSGIEEVLAGVVDLENEQYSALVHERARTADSGRDGLTELIDGLLAGDDRTAEHWKLWLDFWAMAAHHQRYADWQAQVYRDLHAATADLLVRGNADGSLRVGDPTGEAIELIAMLDGLVVQAYLPGSALSPARARRILHTYVDATMAVHRPN